MDKKIVGIAVIVVIVVIVLAVFLASGGSDESAEIIIGNSTPADDNTSTDIPQDNTKTFDLAYCSLELPEDTKIINRTKNSTHLESVTYMITSSSTNESFIMSVSSGDGLVSSTDSYISNLESQGTPVEKIKDYKKWTIVKSNATRGDPYMAVNVEGGHGFIIYHEDVDSLEKIIDVFKFKG